MKGITPIVSTIILLLIAIALAGTAYVYLSGLIGPLTSKDFMIVQGSEMCTVDTNIKMRIVNTGTAKLASSSTDSDIKSLYIDTTALTPATSIAAFNLEPGKDTEITITCSATTCPSGLHIVKIGTLSGVKSARVTC